VKKLVTGTPAEVAKILRLSQCRVNGTCDEGVLLKEGRD